MTSVQRLKTLAILRPDSEKFFKFEDHLRNGAFAYRVIGDHFLVFNLKFKDVLNWCWKKNFGLYEFWFQKDGGLWFRLEADLGGFYKIKESSVYPCFSLDDHVKAVREYLQFLSERDFNWKDLFGLTIDDYLDKITDENTVTGYFQYRIRHKLHKGFNK